MVNKNNFVELNGKKYEDYDNCFGYVNYRIIACPICGGDLVKEYDKEDTPGFRCSTTTIVDRNCNCDLEKYYKENKIQILVRK